jgi:hypothetical protein
MLAVGMLATLCAALRPTAPADVIRAAKGYVEVYYPLPDGRSWAYRSMSWHGPKSAWIVEFTGPGDAKAAIWVRGRHANWLKARLFLVSRPAGSPDVYDPAFEAEPW